MRKLQQEMTAFFRELYTGEQKILVFGEGNEKAGIMLIGEAPGEQESLQGRPFVGRAGKNLDEFLTVSGIKREDVYITNVVKFRPVKQSKAGRVVNRPPTQEEVKLSLAYLLREIELVSPKVIVTLGNVPLKALLGRNMTVGAAHGKWFELGGRKLYPMYHPASVIYNPSLKEIYREDIVGLGRAYAQGHD